VIDRFSNALAAVLHVALVLLLGRITFAPHEDEQRKKGMTIEIIDFEHAMPDARPAIADAPASVPAQSSARDTLSVEPETAAMPSAPARSEPAVAPKLAASDFVSESPATVPLPSTAPTPAPIVEEPAQVAKAAPAAQPKPSTATPARLDTGAFSGVREVASRDARPLRLNSATLGSAVGKATPRGLQGLTFRQKIDLAEKVRAQVMPCWNPPTADGPASASVRLKFRLDREGRVVGQPVQSGVTGQNEASAAYINLLTNSGRRAVLMCSPLRLPPELYEAWADVEVEFDPRDLR
jgi:hypothetical protein